MISVEKVKRGLAAFLDAELMPHLPSTGWESIVVGAAVGIILKRFDKVVDALKCNKLAQTLEVVGKDGSIDIDIIRDELRQQIERKGSLEVLNVPILEKLTFRPDDIDKAYKFIMEA